MKKFAKKNKKYISNESCRLNYFWKQIQSIHDILPQLGNLPPKETVILLQSLISYFIICTYALFEIVYKDFRKMKEFYNLRQKLVHGNALFQNRKGKKVNLSKYKVTTLPRINVLRDRILFSLIWQVTKEDGEVTYLINNKEKHSFIDKDGARHNFPDKPHNELIELLNNDPVYICSSGSFICDATKLYELCQSKVEYYLNNKS